MAPPPPTPRLPPRRLGHVLSSPWDSTYYTLDIFSDNETDLSLLRPRQTAVDDIREAMDDIMRAVYLLHVELDDALARSMTDREVWHLVSAAQAASQTFGNGLRAITQQIESFRDSS